MEVKKKIKLKLKSEYLQELYESYPNAFEKEEKTIKIKYENNNFVKLMKKTVEWQKFIIDNLGVTYIGYMNILLDSLDYDNKVDFKYLKKLGIKDGMIKMVRKKFIETNIVKKIDNQFYLNPMVAIKGETINPILLSYFE